MKGRVVTLDEIMRRIANGDSMDNYQVIHKMKLSTGEYVIQNVKDVKKRELISDEKVNVKIY